MRAQTAFEYVLIVAGIVVLVVVSYMLVRGGVIPSAGGEAQLKACQAQLASQYDRCYSGTQWNGCGIVSCSLCENFPFKGRTSGYAWCPGATDSSVCYCGPAPLSATASPASTTARLNNFEYGFTVYRYELNSFSEAKIEFIANHFSLVMVTAGEDSQLSATFAKLKSLNSNFKALKYTNGVIDYAYKPGDEREECYLHNPNTPQKDYRITDIGQIGGYGLDACSDCWRNFFVESANESMQYGFDGVFVDDMSAKIDRFEPPAPYAQNYWHNCKKELLNHIKTELGDKLVTFNGLYHKTDYTCSDFLEVADGALKEGFVTKLAQYDSFLNEMYWKAMLNAILNDITPDKYFSADCKLKNDIANADGRMFCFTSFLLIYSPNIKYSVKDVNTDEPQYYPEMNVNIGTPTETKSTVDGYYDGRVYVRDYSNGKVIVNPSETETVTYPLDKTYYLVIPEGGGVVDESGDYEGSLSYEEVSQVTVSPQTGKILLENLP